MTVSNNSAVQLKPFAEHVFVLIVTDSQLTQKYVSAILREIMDLGNVQYASTREDAMKILKSDPGQHCSFIFYEHDHNETHDAFIETIRQEDDTAATPVVVLGPRVPDNYDAEHARQQLTNYLQRPFVPSALISILFDLFQEKDRRLAKRISTNDLPCVVDMGYYATKPYSAELINLSYTGCLLRTQHDYDDCGSVDDIGHISFKTVEGIEIRLTGKIVRTDKGEYHQIGFQFQNNEEEDLVNLGRFISAYCKNRQAG